MALLLAMWLVVGAICLFQEGHLGRGVQHSRLKTMDQGGAGDRHDGLLVTGWLFGAISIGIFVCLTAFGVRGDRRPWLLFAQLVLGTLGYVGVYTAMMWTYREFAGDGETQFISWLPTPTAIMLFGLWAAPLYFVGLYVWYFNEWVFSSSDEEKFRQLVAAQRKSEGGKP